MKRSKFLHMLLLVLLLIPGSALAEIYLNLVHPGNVFVGETFTVTVNIVVTDNIPSTICAYQYNMSYDDNKVLMDPGQFQPPVIPQMDGQFFSRTGCNVDPFTCPTAPGLPLAINCCKSTGPTCSPARFGFWDGSNFLCDDEEPPNCGWADPKATPLSMPGRTSATFTFRALEPGCFNFDLFGSCPKEVGDCPVDPDTDPIGYDISRIENSYICVRPPKLIPVLSDFGMLLFALGLTTLAVYFIRKHGRSRI
jgi:hypothetical protein